MKRTYGLSVQGDFLLLVCLFLSSFNAVSQSLDVMPQSACEHGDTVFRFYYSPYTPGPNNKQLAYYKFELEGEVLLSNEPFGVFVVHLSSGNHIVYASVKYTDSTSSSSSISQIHVYPTPIAELIPIDSMFVVNKNSCFRKLSSYIWIDWGDGVRDTNYCHTYLIPGQYGIELTAVNIYGCVSRTIRTIDVVSSTGIKEIGKDNKQVFIHPVPTYNGIIYTSFSNSTIQQYIVTIYNVIGEKLDEKRVTNNSEVDLSYLPNGLYVAVIEKEDYQCSQRIIISK